MKRFLWLGWMACLFLMCTGCGDTFRPIIIPNPPTFPDPRAAHTVISINNNGSVASGSVLVVDVSGDSEVSIANVGVTPVYAVQQGANLVLVLNQATTTTATASLSKVFFSSTTISGTPGTISLPADSDPNFVAIAPLDTTAYVTLPNLVPDPTNFPNDNAVGVVGLSSNSMVATIRVGNNPVAIAVTPDKDKLYVANQGDSSISNFNTLDRSPRNTSPIALGAVPVWLAARSDSQRVYVLEANGSLATIDTTSTSGPDTLLPAISVPAAKTMLYDGKLNRLYIPGGTEVAVVDVAQSVPATLSTVAITPVSPATRSAQDPCSLTATAALNTVAAAALPDGSRAYFGAYYEDAAGNICPQVTVINTSNNSVKAVIAVPGFPNYDVFCASSPYRFTMAAGGDSSRAYLASCDGGGVSTIDTATDTFLVNLPAPFSARAPIPPSTLPPPQNPVFLFAGP